MSWKATIDGREFLLDDLSENDFVEATLPHEGVNWLTLYSAPGAHPGALYDLLCSVALKLGVAQPVKPKNVKEAVKLLDCITRVDIDDDLPTNFDDGGLPLADQVDQETNTSSTSTEPEDGAPSKPDELP